MALYVEAPILAFLIEAAMGKSVSGRDSEEVIHEYGDALKPSNTTSL